jgi:hypothetical protein
MKTKRAAIAALLVAALAMSGCAAALLGAAAGVGGYKYAEGSLETTYNKPYEEVYSATLASLKQQNMAVAQTTRDAAGAHIKAKRADGTDVSIDLAKTGPDTTKANIRVGYLGDENASKTIANNIAKQVNEAERTPETGQGGK